MVYLHCSSQRDATLSPTMFDLMTLSPDDEDYAQVAVADNYGGNYENVGSHERKVGLALPPGCVARALALVLDLYQK